MGVNRSRVIKRIKEKLAAAFDMVDMGSISFYFSLKVEKNSIKKILKLSKSAYIDKILVKYHLD